VLTEGTHVSERLGDGSEWEVAKVGHDRFLGELHELLLGLHATQIRWLERAVDNAPHADAATLLTQSRPKFGS